jgi:acyl-CoA reductase-like NAD-dependent aldehyde dehydrogenase
VIELDNRSVPRSSLALIRLQVTAAVGHFGGSRYELALLDSLDTGKLVTEVLAPDVPSAVQKAIFGAFSSQGAVCSANSRLLLEKSVASDFVAERVAVRIRPGNPVSPDATLGAIVDG